MKQGSSLIELVIAIVVMGIAVMTLPLLLTQTQANNAYTLQQEVILAARTKIGDTQTYRWDENSLDENARISVLVTDGDSELNVSTNGRRIGHVFANKRRKFSADLNTSTTPANLGPDVGDPNDIDDFSVSSDNLVDSNQSTNLDYRFLLFDLNTTVDYVSDSADYNGTNIDFTLQTTPATTSTNIKLLTIKVSGADIPNPFILRSYSTNIGESELLRRSY